MKKKIIAMAATVMVLANSMTVLAAPEQVEVNGETFTSDSEFYARNNPDVVAALGTSKEALLQHYVSYGRAEGRAAYQTDAAEPAATLAVPNDEPRPVKAEFHQGKDLSSIREFVYDENGRKVAELEYQNDTGSGKGLNLAFRREYSYDANGNLIGETEYLVRTGGTTYSLQYDGKGNVTYEYRSLRNSTSTYTYDYNESGKPTVSYRTHDGVTSLDTQYTYDSNGRLTQKADDIVTITYSYDKKGRLIKESSDNGTYTYSYDKQGRLSKVTEPNGVMIYYY